MKKKELVEVSTRYGMLAFVLLVAYFMIMKFLNLIQYQELRAFNGVLILISVAIAVSKIKHLDGEKLNYFKGIGCGMLTSLFGVLPFAFFVLFYLLFDNAFLRTIQERSAYGTLITPFTGAFVNFIEGMAAGMISSFITMQYYKPSLRGEMREREAKIQARKIITPKNIH